MVAKFVNCRIQSEINLTKITNAHLVPHFRGQHKILSSFRVNSAYVDLVFQTLIFTCQGISCLIIHHFRGHYTEVVKSTQISRENHLFLIFWSSFVEAKYLPVIVNHSGFNIYPYF